jgi:hypothetical protein
MGNYQTRAMTAASETPATRRERAIDCAMRALDQQNPGIAVEDRVADRFEFTRKEARAVVEEARKRRADRDATTS